MLYSHPDINHIDQSTTIHYLPIPMPVPMPMPMPMPMLMPMPIPLPMPIPIPIHAMPVIHTYQIVKTNCRAKTPGRVQHHIVHACACILITCMI